MQKPPLVLPWGAMAMGRCLWLDTDRGWSGAAPHSRTAAGEQTLSSGKGTGWLLGVGGECAFTTCCRCKMPRRTQLTPWSIDVR